MVAFALIAMPTRAADAPVSISEVAIGFDGALKVGRWTPVAFRIEGPSGATVEPSVTAPDPDGSEATWKLPSVTLDESGLGRASGVFRMGRLGGAVRVSADTATLAIQASAETSDQQSSCTLYSQDVPFVGVLGPAPGFAAAFAATEADGNPDEAAPKGRLAEFESADALPVLSAAYDALDVVVLSQKFDLDEARSAALAEWVRQGGCLIIALNDDLQSFTSSPVSRWAPVAVIEPAQFRELAALIGRVPGSPPLTVNSPVNGVRIQVEDGIVLAGSLNGPLATRSAYGLGRVTVLAVDWSDTRLANWPGLPNLCRYLADLEPESRESSAEGSAQLRPTGISDMATQLAAILDHFSMVHRPSYWTVILFAIAFMLLVGPLDYLLVHRVLKQPRLTWFTFPAWILFAAAAATMGADRFNSSERQSNQFDLLDIDALSGQQQVQSWVTIYSPESLRFAVQAQVADWLSDAPAEPMNISWAGSPEAGFGGMYRAGGLNLANPPYTFDDNASAVENVPIAQWSSKGLAATSSSKPASTAQPLVTSELVDDGTGLLTGTFTHHLPDAVTDYCVAYGTGAYFPRASARVDQSPAIAPGVPWSPEDRISRRLLERYLQGLTERYVSSPKAAESSTMLTTEAYDPLGLDPFPLVRLLTFYDAANGPTYSGLTNFGLARDDLSRLLPLKRAVLFGRIASPAATYEVYGAPLQPQERWSFVRIVLPVKLGVAPSLRERGDLQIR